MSELESRGWLPRRLDVLNILGRFHVIPRRLRLGFADRAKVTRVTIPAFLALQNRGFALLEAGSTKVMRGLAIVHRFLKVTFAIIALGTILIFGALPILIGRLVSSR